MVSEETLLKLEKSLLDELCDVPRFLDERVSIEKQIGELLGTHSKVRYCTYTEWADTSNTVYPYLIKYFGFRETGASLNKVDKLLKLTEDLEGNQMSLKILTNTYMKIIRECGLTSCRSYVPEHIILKLRLGELLSTKLDYRSYSLVARFPEQERDWNYETTITLDSDTLSGLSEYIRSVIN